MWVPGGADIARNKNGNSVPGGVCEQLDGAVSASIDPSLAGAQMIRTRLRSQRRHYSSNFGRRRHG